MTTTDTVQGYFASLTQKNGWEAFLSDDEVRDLMVDGQRACALTRYHLQPPGGAPAFTSDVAEVFGVRDGRIRSFDIYFDTAPFPK